MQLYLMQHGEALSGEEDPERPLSAVGVSTIQASARAIVAMGLRFDVVIASSKARARQTAEIVADAIDYDTDAIVIDDSVKPSAPVAEALTLLQQFTTKETVFVAGHLPSLRGLTSRLFAARGGGRIDFTNGGLCRIDVATLPTDAAKLCWYIPPEEMRAMGEGDD